MERKSYSIDINRIAQYAMYAYCIFALFSLAFSVCGQASLSFRTSPILIPISPILVTIKQLVLQLAPIALWGIFRYTLPAGVKLLRRCSELMVLYYVLSFILGQCFNLHLVTMMQNGQITQMAFILTWTESTMGLISVIASLIAGCHLCSKHRGNMRKLGIANCPGFHRMAAMLESPPDGSVLPGRQHPADSLHQREYHQYDNNDIGIYIRLLHDVSGNKRLKKVIKNSVSEFSRHQERSSNINPRTIYEIQRHP